MKRIWGIVAYILLITLNCTDKKGDNPLTTNNLAPTLELIGFSSDTLVYVSNRGYPFEFIATDEVKKPTVKIKVLTNTGTIRAIDNTSAGRYKAIFVPSRKGAHTLEITVTDGLETESKTLGIYLGDNQNPVAEIAYREVMRDVPNSQFTFEFDASASRDRDSQIVKALWDLDGQAMENDIKNKFEHTFDYYADYQIKLTVEDEFGGSNSASAHILNSRPLASFVIRPAEEALNGDQITLDATDSASPHGDVTNYKWLSKEENGALDVLAETMSSVYRFDIKMLVGQNLIGLLIEDSGGNVSDTTWNPLTIINQPPQVDFVFSTELARIFITKNEALDPDPGDEITMNWLLNGAEQPDKQNQRLPSFEVPGAVYQLTLYAQDQHGGQDSVTKSISVPGVPEAVFVFPSGITDNFESLNGRTFTIDGRNSKAGNESVGLDRFTWFLRAPNQTTEVLSDGSVSFLALSLNHPVGQYQIGLKVRNVETRESLTTWKNLFILNSAPTAQFDCQFQAFAEGLVYRIIANGSSDPDPKDVISYRWFLDGIEQTNITSATPTFTRSHSQVVTTITLYVSDSHGGENSESTNGRCEE